MVMDFSTPGECYLNMKDYIEKIVDEWKVEKDATSLLVHDREFAIESQIIDGKDEVIIYRSTIFQIESSNIRTCFTIIITMQYHRCSRGVR